MPSTLPVRPKNGPANDNATVGAFDFLGATRVDLLGPSVVVLKTTCATGTLQMAVAIDRHPCVRLVELVTIEACGLRGVARCWSNAAKHVFSLLDHLEVFRVCAGSVAAQVIQDDEDSFRVWKESSSI